MAKKLPIGHQYALAMASGGEEELFAVADQLDRPDLLEAFLAVHNSAGDPSFLHSALCAMSLPVFRPKDEAAPIFRQDGKYSLAVTPRSVLRRENGKSIMKVLGMPYGVYPRVILIYIMTQAVRNNSRDIYLGQNLSDWLRRLGMGSLSYGRTGNVPRVIEQLDRLLACEFQFRFDEDQGSDEPAFAVKDVRVSDEYRGVGNFERQLRLSEAFKDQLQEHAVPLDEAAIAILKGNATALDFYTWLAYRLPRLTRDTRVMWSQFAVHMGNESSGRAFRQRIRLTLPLVLAVYPQADVDFSGATIILRPSPAPVDPKRFGTHMRLVGSATPKIAPPRSLPSSVEKVEQLRLPEMQPVLPKLGSAKPALLLPFPSGSLRYGDRERAYFLIARDHGDPWDVDIIADAFRDTFKSLDKLRAEEEWLGIWRKFCMSYGRSRSSY